MPRYTVSGLCIRIPLHVLNTSFHLHEVQLMYIIYSQIGGPRILAFYREHKQTRLQTVKTQHRPNQNENTPDGPPYHAHR